MNQTTRTQRKIIKDSLAYESLKLFLENPVLELLAGYLLISQAKHTYQKKWLVEGTKINDMVTGMHGIYDVPLLSRTEANWAEIALVLAVAAQQMKGNPELQRSIISGGAAIGAAGIDTVGKLTGAVTGGLTKVAGALAVA